MSSQKTDGDFENYESINVKAICIEEYDVIC